MLRERLKSTPSFTIEKQLTTREGKSTRTVNHPEETTNDVDEGAIELSENCQAVWNDLYEFQVDALRPVFAVRFASQARQSPRVWE